MPHYMGGLAFRDFEIFNPSLLTMQASRILDDPSSLSAILLNVAYLTGSSFLDAQVGGHPSQVLRAIVEGKEVLKQGLIRRIGNGSTTHIWK